jgi:uncharacterized protein (TIGR00369 family)
LVQDAAVSLRRTKDDILQFAKVFPFFNLIGLEIEDIAPKWSRTKITWRPDLTQPAGIMHGGVIASLIDTGIAQALILTDEFQAVINEGGALVSVDLRIKYFRPVTSGAIYCESKIPRLGKRIIHASSIVTDANGKEVAAGDSIYMVVKSDDLQRRP